MHDYIHIQYCIFNVYAYTHAHIILILLKHSKTKLITLFFLPVTFLLPFKISLALWMS